MFTLFLGRNGASIKCVVEAFSKPPRQLDQSVGLEVNDNPTTILAFAMTFLEDTSQQADIAGFTRHSANMGCRICFCHEDQRAEVDYDIITNGRYHWESV